MNNQKIQEGTFLGRWLSGTLSTKELETFKKSSDYSIYVKIVDGLSKLKTLPYSKEIAYREFKQKMLS